MPHTRGRLSTAVRRATIPRLLASVAGALLFTLPACSREDGGTAPGAPTPTGPTVTQVYVTGSLFAARPGDSAQFQATAMLSNGGSRPVTKEAAWRSSDTNVATVTSEGLVTATAAGAAEIRATYQGVSGSLAVTIAALPPGPPTFIVSGTIKDAANVAPVPGATVTVKNAAPFALSDANGRYRLSGVRAGAIVLRVTKAGYETVETTVNVAADTTADVTINKIGG